MKFDMWEFYYMNNNQHNALFIISLLNYYTSTCFGHISSPSSAGKGKGKGTPATGHQGP
jgi:hypothetical protein